MPQSRNPDRFPFSVIDGSGRPEEILLSRRRAAFVREYASSHNTTQAAIKAGYSANAATKVAYKLLQDPKIRRVLLERQKRLASQAEIDHAWLLHEFRVTTQEAKANSDFSATTRCL